MIEVLLGTGAFGLYILYDVLAMKGAKRAVLLFVFASAVLSCSTAALMIKGNLAAKIFEMPVLTCICAAFAVIFLCLLLYALFFALPIKDAYNGGGTVVATGVYALCRHPAAMFFLGFTLCFLGMMRNWETLAATAVWNIGEIIYIWIEDKAIFPKTLKGYDTYRETTPFLIPNRTSVKAAFGRKNR